MTLVVLVDEGRLRVVDTRGAVTTAALHTPVRPDVDRWADAAGAVLEGVLPRAGRRVDLVLVLGLGVTEIALPSLPPIDPAAQRRMLERDGDRYFPIAGEVAVAWRDGIAFGVDAALVRALRASMERFGTVRAIVTLAELLAQHGARAGASASRRSLVHLVDAGPGEQGVLRVEGGAVREARRVPLPGPVPDGIALTDDVLVALAPAGRALAGAGTSAMVLDRETRALVDGRRRQRWYRSAAGLVAATVLLALAIDRRQAGALDAATARFERSRGNSVTALAARNRLRRVTRELSLVGAHAGRRSLAETLDRIGRILPPDAWVERLEWDGAAWRIDGSAASAARLVPLLDADPSVEGVRVLAASTRFVDRGRQRESFSIAFTVRDDAATAPLPRGGARGAP